ISVNCKGVVVPNNCMPVTCPLLSTKGMPGSLVRRVEPPVDVLVGAWMFKVGWRYSWGVTGEGAGVSVGGVVLPCDIIGQIPALLANSMPFDEAEADCATVR